ncbi:hypothetical protein AB0I53_08130 [Saccharopolyspora sp. NPDC050389]|uniref:hypothetical protein n=1 Tax=Saccharopolyspora sp. NPDC050389 TaxID=3155516 RepID=UPI0033D7947E
MPRSRTFSAPWLGMALGALALTGCTGPVEPPALPPAGVYEHGAAGESSWAEPIPPGGTAESITAPLTDAGWFCAQVRVNADGRALWCRVGHRDATDTIVPQVAQFVLDRDDQLTWAWFPFPQLDPGSEDPVTAAAVPALAAIWAGAGDRIRQEIDDFQQDRRRRDGTEIPRTAWRDRHADYTLSAVDGLVVTARDASVRRWPFAAEHYATTMSSAVDDLRAGGYDCAYPPQQACNRVQSNGYFRVSLRGDQIVSAQFGIGSWIEAGRQRHPLSQEFPRGLTFLTEEVRRAVTERIEDCRLSGTGFAGIVAGTVVIVDARRGPVDGADHVSYLDVQIGVPLAGT